MSKYDVNVFKKNLKRIRSAFSDREPILKFRSFGVSSEKSEQAAPKKEIVVVKEPQNMRVDTLSNQNKSGILYGGNASNIQLTQRFRERYREPREQKQPQEEAHAQSENQETDLIDVLLKTLQKRRRQSVFSSVRRLANAHATAKEIETKKEASEIKEEQLEKRKRNYVHY